MERARSFGAVTEDYERFRPGYPDDLVALVSEVADGPVRRAIEIGAGVKIDQVRTHDDSCSKPLWLSPHHERDRTPMAWRR